MDRGYVSAHGYSENLFQCTYVSNRALSPSHVKEEMSADMSLETVLMSCCYAERPQQESLYSPSTPVMMHT